MYVDQKLAGSLAEPTKRGNLRMKSPKFNLHMQLASSCWQRLSSQTFITLFLHCFIHPMSANRVKTRSTNTAQHPGLLIPKQTRRSTAEVTAIRQAKEDAKKEKESTKKANIQRVAEFERTQAEEDAIERTPRVVTTKPKPLVRTWSYADVLRSSDVEMVDGTADPGSTFELAPVEPGQTTDDGMETEFQALPPGKKVRRFFFFSPIYHL